MKSVTFIRLILVILLAAPEIAAGDPTLVKKCDSVSLAHRNFGVAYRGRIENGDYLLTLDIPRGFTGWGAAPKAPFHGFTVFLSGKPGSCLNFEIHLRIDLDGEEADRSAHTGQKMAVGNREGWAEKTTGLIEGSGWTNVHVTFSVDHGKEILDGSIWLITSNDALEKNTATFKRFLSRIKFGN